MRHVFRPLLVFLLLTVLLGGCSGEKVIETTSSPAGNAAPLPSETPAPTPEPTPVVIRALDREFSEADTELDLRQVRPDRLEEILDLVSRLPQLERIETAPEDPEEKSLWQLEDLSRLREAVDESIAISCRFDLFGHSVSSDDEEIVYFREYIGDEQLPVLRQAIPLLSGCHRLLLDDCMLTYEKLAELREEYPERGIVWRVRFGVDSALTDTIRIWSISVTDQNCDVLKYCTEVLYIDVGEIQHLSDFHFLYYMTKLQVVIVAHTWFEDIGFVVNCPDLEFLEADYCRISDLSLLPQCKNLRHLSLENDLRLTDITPLYEMPWLERLRVSVVPNVPKAQRQALATYLPNTLLIDEATHPVWRWTSDGGYMPRYALLREQIGYGIHLLPTDTLDWNYINQMHYSHRSVFTCS